MKVRSQQTAKPRRIKDVIMSIGFDATRKITSGQRAYVSDGIAEDCGVPPEKVGSCLARALRGPRCNDDYSGITKPVVVARS